MASAVQLFGGRSDGAMAMEEWLVHMCQGCRRGVTRDGLAGMNCPLPAKAYAEPYDDMPEWHQVDEALLPAELGGMVCAEWSARPKRPPRQVAGQQSLLEAS